MSEEKEIDNFGCKYAITGVSAFIFNKDGKLLLTRSPKWGNLWVVPGGKVDFGESMEQTLKREMKEELNLDISNIEYLTTIELNRTEERPNLHMVVNEFIATADDDDVKLNDEHSEFDWRKPEEWFKEKDVYPATREIIGYYLNEFLPKKDCENLYKRALADYQNLLKQTAKEKMEFAVYANEQMLREILPVYDHLKMAIEHHSEESKDEWLTGVKFVVKQFKDVLEKIGVEEITAEKKFDHNLMEALSNEETEDESLDGKVAKQVKAGYKLNGKVIEPAKVIVYKLK
ncbi:MAG: nucleotide exchange factor GrpE [Patescibacteria group bacterium]|jgi:molecular chaperone GrpE (heat shock protein)